MRTWVNPQHPWKKLDAGACKYGFCPGELEMGGSPRLVGQLLYWMSSVRDYDWRSIAEGDKNYVYLPSRSSSDKQSSESTKIHSREQTSLLNLFIERWVTLKQSHWTYLWLHRQRPLPLAFSCLHAQPCWSLSPPIVRAEWHTTSWEEWVDTQVGGVP